MSGGFGAGFLKGAIFSVFAAGAVSLTVPLAPLDPKQKTQVDLTTPSGSGFNAGRTDTNPVLPNTDQTVSKESVSKPKTTSTGGDLLVNGTKPATKPTAQSGSEMPTVSTGDDELAMIAPKIEEGPVITQPALGVPMPVIDNPVIENSPAQSPVIVQPDSTSDKPVVSTDVTDAGKQPDPQVQTTIAEQDGSALMRNRVTFDNPTGKPVFAVILIDAGAEGLDRDILTTFTFPVSFALDPNGPDASTNAADLRKAGFEVLALAPSGSTALIAAEQATDLDAALAAVFAKIPDAVALVDRPSADIQKDTTLAEQVVASLKGSGHGLVTYDIGLNGTDQKATRAGVRAGTVFRVLDASREKSETIKRYLDRAVLEAGKTGSIIVLGRTYPETVTALFSWAVSGKSTAVTLAPVSAVLLAR